MVMKFTNFGRNFFGRLTIDPNTGTARGLGAMIEQGLSYPSTATYDEFALNRKGTKAFLSTSGGNSISRVDIKTGKQEIVAGYVNSTEIAQPTAPAFERAVSSCRLFVTTAGGLAFPVNGNEIIGGQIVEVQLRADG